MISFPNAKINIGLQVVSKRQDGYHNIESIFYPVKLCDALEFVESKKTELTISGIQIDGNAADNIILKAYNLMGKDFILPSLHFHLHKAIPFGAGLGGGSSDAAFALKMINSNFNLKLSDEKLGEYAALIGADCTFFIRNKPSYVTGIGNELYETELDISDYSILIVKPAFGVNTAEAYRNIIPKPSQFNLNEIEKLPVGDWKMHIFNDFEPFVLSKYPIINDIKSLLYKNGALFASMSGSGSAVFGIFRHLPAEIEKSFPGDWFTYRQ